MDPRESQQPIEEASIDEAPARHAEQLTEREAALYSRGHRDAYLDLLDELRRADESGDAVDEFTQVVRNAKDRLDRIAPAGELPPSPCGIATTYALVPILCGFSAGHELERAADPTADPDGTRHSWAMLPAWPPEQRVTPPSRIRPAITRALAAAARGMLEELEKPW